MISILIIESDPEISTMLEAALLSDRCSVQTVQKGQAGLKLLAERTFDVVIADIIMPDYDGFEVIMEINCMHPRPRVIAMTGWAGNVNRAYLSSVADALSVQHLLYKPFSITKLLELVYPEKG